MLLHNSHKVEIPRPRNAAVAVTGSVRDDMPSRTGTHTKILHKNLSARHKIHNPGIYIYTMYNMHTYSPLHNLARKLSTTIREKLENHIQSHQHLQFYHIK